MFEEKSLEQGYNGVKYLLTIIAVCLRTAYGFETNKNHKFILKVLAGSASVLAAVFCTYWDFVHDWGLLNRTSKNRWLRDKLLVPHKRVYFIAMVHELLKTTDYLKKKRLYAFQLCNLHYPQLILEIKFADFERCVEVRMVANSIRF